MVSPWSISEVEAAVGDYFNMLRMELTGQQYNKAEHRRVLVGRLNNRSHGSVELKHQNISAVLVEMGIPYISGYKPRFNYQALLAEVIAGFLNGNQDIHEFLLKDLESVPAIPSVQDILKTMVSAPKAHKEKSMGIGEPRPLYRPVRINYLEKESRNNLLGEAGEKFILNFERARLIRAGKEHLADRIEQVSLTTGPSAGFDILSFEENGSDRYIEAKTTKYGKETPFFITSNELKFSERNSSRYFLYRLFDFRVKPGIYTLQGYLASQCSLQPSVYMAELC